MQVRHRIPSIFNLSMVDVLCCALGCVILLWLVYFKEARERSIAAGHTNKELTATKLKLDSVLRDLTASQDTLLAGKQRNNFLSGQFNEVLAQRDQLLAKWEKTDRDHEAVVKSLQEARAAAANLRKEVKDLETRNADVRSAVAEKNKDLAIAAAQAADLKSKLADTEQRASKLDNDVAALKVLSKEYGQQLAKTETKAMGLEADLGKRQLEIAEANKRLNDLLALKDRLETQLATAKTDLARSAALEKDLTGAANNGQARMAQLEKDLAAARGELAKGASLEKELAAARANQAGLAAETKDLAQQLGQYKSAADNRFAGIEMTGSRVLFLVDMSGSMGMKNDDTADPEKWALVCEILAKLMKSLPELKQFQIILFSDRIRYPLGNERMWHNYFGPASIKIAVETVRAVTPQNATNMSAVLEEAFRYRALGLDTIYLMSDGLPNMGDGLPANAGRLSEAERGAVLGKYIRDRLKSTWNVPYGRWTQQRVRINAVGFYFDSPDVGAFLWALARDNNGSFVGLSKP